MSIDQSVTDWTINNHRWCWRSSFWQSIDLFFPCLFLQLMIQPLKTGFSLKAWSKRMSNLRVCPSGQAQWIWPIYTQICLSLSVMLGNVTFSHNCNDLDVCATPGSFQGGPLFSGGSLSFFKKKKKHQAASDLFHVFSRNLEGKCEIRTPSQRNKLPWKERYRTELVSLGNNSSTPLSWGQTLIKWYKGIYSWHYLVRIFQLVQMCRILCYTWMKKTDATYLCSVSYINLSSIK